MPYTHRLLAAFIALSAACTAARAASTTTPKPQAQRAHRHVSARAIADYVRARLSEDAGDTKGAIDALRHALVHDPDSPQLRMSYAEALARVGRLDTAEGEARRAVELATDGAAAADAHLALGKVLAAAGRLTLAERELETATRLESDRVRAFESKHAGDSTEVDDDRSATLDPEPWRALSSLRLAKGDPKGAVAACEALGAHDREAGAGALREVAAKVLDAKDAALAERTVRRSLELAPADAEGWKLLARAEEDQQHLDEARNALQRALTADPADPDALLSAGQLALRQGDLAAARGWFRQLLRVAPDEVVAKMRVAAAWLDAKRPDDALEVAGGGDQGELLYLRGVALLQLRRWRDAATVLEAVTPAARDVYPYARASLAQALAREGEPKEAVKAVQRGLEMLPRNPVLLFALGESYDRAGERDAALAQMRAVLAVKPDYPEALNYLGYAYAERGERLGEAEAFLRRAVASEPDNAYFLDSLGWVLFKKGDVQDAVQTLERASKLAGPEPTILDHLGDAYTAAHRPGDAASAYRGSLDAEDADDDPREASARRAAVERKLEELGTRDIRPATATRH